MKTSIQKITFAVLFALVTIIPTNAQQFTHIRTMELNPFNEIKLSVDAEVILLKSERNHLTLVGDSAYIADLQVTNDNNDLSFTYQEDGDQQVHRVVIEYTSLEKAITGGNGAYFFHKLDVENLEVYNAFASVMLNGYAKSIKIYSEEGDNDVTGLTADRMELRIGDSATLLKREDGVLYSARRNR